MSSARGLRAVENRLKLVHAFNRSVSSRPEPPARATSGKIYHVDTAEHRRRPCAKQTLAKSFKRRLITTIVTLPKFVSLKKTQIISFRVMLLTILAFFFRY
ncbi:hypothetical protein PUN28_011564 [Cardiocondyla obscurior]|uniref:Uncharacterized protein n=1 Tax=Cardiocondyla obscurior TaxID=286306 RepID=A0AAW2FJQ0_9HYME